MKVVRFNYESSPTRCGYFCSEPGDMGGEYVPAEEARAIEAAQLSIEADYLHLSLDVERVRSGGYRAVHAENQWLCDIKRQRDQLLAACKEAAGRGRHAPECGWWDHRFPEGLIHEHGVCNCWLSRLNAVIAEAEKP